MTVLSRGARVRRGGRRPGWVLLTALLVLAMGASSALVFTNRVELLKLAVILALWAAVAGAFVSVLYRRQSDADQSRVRDLKLVYDLQLDREISARREYELTVESQLRRELATELRAQADEDLATLRAELSALRTSLEILFDTDLQHRPALETLETEAPRARAYGDWERNGETNADWVSSDRVTSATRDDAPGRTDMRDDEAAIIDVPEVGVPPASAASEGPLLPPRRERGQYDARPRFEPQQRPPQPPPAAQPEPQPQPQMQDWQPAASAGQWLPSGAPGSNWAGSAPGGEPPSDGRRARHYGIEEPLDGAPVEPAQAPQYGEAERWARARHAAEYREYGAPVNEPVTPPHPMPAPPAAAPPPPQMAPPPYPEPTPRHRGVDPQAPGPDDLTDGPPSGGQSVADLLARLQVEPSGGGRRRRREG